MIITITFVLNDNRKDNPRYTFSIAIRYKSDYNNESDRFHINDLNKMTNLKNSIFYCKITNKCILASVFSISIIIDAMEK